MKRLHIVLLVLGILIVGLASYLWNRGLSHDIAHDSPTPHAESADPSDSKGH